jgi:hypothetical protein
VDNKKLNLIGQIDKALEHVTEVFLHQCTYGAQTKSLPPELAACGQFIGGDAEAIKQSGLHGISAALRVLGPCQSEECGQIVQRLVSFCEACFGINPEVPTRSDLDDRGDKENIIKLGELLYGLSFVATAQAECDRLVKHVAAKLVKSLVDNKGWGYFTDDTDPQLLPTAYAVRGLAQNGYDISAPRKFLLEGLTVRGRASAADLTTVVACAYCLTFCRNSDTQDMTLRSAFRMAWRSLEPLLAEGIEQNLEYWRGKDTHYIRIPWQLYLLALASEYSLWRFAAFRAQRRIHAVINAVRSDSFKYPYSGRYLSSRTNSVAYDVLSAIRDRVRHFVLLRLAYVIDYARVSAGSRFARVVVGLLAAGLIFYSIQQWWMHVGTVGDLAPHFVYGFIMLLLAWARR